jgi:hypothetical protein
MWGNPQRWIRCGKVRNVLITMGPQLWDPPHKVTPLRQVAKDRSVNVVLALSKDHT